MMLNQKEILEVLRSNKSYFEHELGVKRIGLFGSYAKNLQTSDSDVDIFLEMDENDYKKILKLLLFLEQTLNSKVDLIYKGEHLRQPFLHTLESEIIYA